MKQVFTVVKSYCDECGKECESFAFEAAHHEGHLGVCEACAEMGWIIACRLPVADGERVRVKVCRGLPGPEWIKVV